MNATTIAFLSGWCGGIAGCLCSFPFDTIKTLMQHQPASYRSVVGTSHLVYRMSGVRGFYHGAAAPITFVGAITAVIFVTYCAIEQLAVTLLFGKEQEAEGKDEKRVEHVLPLWAVGLCGAATGVVSSCVQGPAELVKIRQQTATSAGRDHRLLHVLRALYREGGGLRSFTKGLGATLCRDVPGSWLWFGSYEAVRRCCTRTDGTGPQRPSAAVSLLAGGVAGFVSYGVVQPMDVVKTVLQADARPLSQQQRHYYRYTEVVREIVRRHGLRGFYAGVWPSLCRAVAANAAVFAGRDSCAQYLERYR